MSSAEVTERLATLKAAVERMAAERYSSADVQSAIEDQAAQAGDCEYLLAHIRFLKADRESAWFDVPWLAPSHRVSAKDALKRIKSICGLCPDLFSAMALTVSTHQGVPREALAAAIKNFRADAAAYTQEDLVGLLTSIWNGGKQGFDAVLRTRKNAERKAPALSWVKDDA